MDVIVDCVVIAVDVFGTKLAVVAVVAMEEETVLSPLPSPKIDFFGEAFEAPPKMFLSVSKAKVGGLNTGSVDAA